MHGPDAGELDTRLEETLAWWRRWSEQIRLDSPDAPAARRSAVVLKGLQNAPPGRSLGPSRITYLAAGPPGRRAVLLRLR